MITNYNSVLTQEIRDVLKLQGGRDRMPQLVEEKIMPVIDVNPKHAKVATVLVTLSKTTTSSNTTLLAANTGKDVYITAINYSCSQDVVCDNVLMTLTGTFNGAASTPIYRRNKNTTTAESFFDRIEFNPALKIDRGTAILYTAAFTAGALSATISIFGYYDENINA